MPRLLLSDERWSKLEKILLQQAIYNKRDLRMTVEGMLYHMRVGCPWRDLPRAFGCWSAIYKRFNAWSASGKWLSVFFSKLLGRRAGHKQQAKAKRARIMHADTLSENRRNRI